MVARVGGILVWHQNTKTTYALTKVVNMFKNS